MKHRLKKGQKPQDVYSKNAASHGRHAAQYNVKTAKKQKGLSLGAKIGIVFGCLVVVAGIGLTVGVTLFDKFLQGNKSDDEFASIKESLNGSSNIKEPFYMLLVGSDTRADDLTTTSGGRSDSCILAYIDPVKHIVTLASIQRDIKVGEGEDAHKFNAAYSSNGIQGCIQSAQNIFDVDISHYAEVNFNAFTAIVDAVGGIDVYIGQTIDDWWAGDQVIEEGWQHLDGTQALIVCRARHYADDDYTRASYQRTVIQTLINKILSNPANIVQTLAAVAGYVSTDLTSADIIGLASSFMNADNITMYSVDFPSTQEYIDGVSYVILDTVDTQKMIKIIEEGGDPNSIQLTYDAYTGTSVESKAGTYDENGNFISQ